VGGATLVIKAQISLELKLKNKYESNAILMQFQYLTGVLSRGKGETLKT
jgi:hypothetical protein